MSFELDLDIPYIARPFRDELINSWLERTASHYGVTWADMLADAPPALREIPDYAVPVDTVKWLARTTERRRKVIVTLDLAYAFPRQPKHRFVLSKPSRIAVAAYCPACLREDFIEGSDQYFRQAWAIAGVGHCHRHRTLLLSRCVECLEVSNYQWHVVDERTRVFCVACGCSLAKRADCHREGWQDERLREAVIVSEEMILDVMRRSPAEVGTTSVGSGLLHVFEDIAYLILANVPGDGDARRYRRRLINWLASTITGINCKTLERINQIKYPLAAPTASVRAWLIAAVIFILCSDDLLNQHDEVELGFKPSLAWLIEMLDAKELSKLKRRAGKWPWRFRSPIRRAWFVTTKGEARNKQQTFQGQAPPAKQTIITLSLHELPEILRECLERNRPRIEEMHRQERERLVQREEAFRRAEVRRAASMYGFQLCVRPESRDPWDRCHKVRRM